MLRKIIITLVLAVSLTQLVAYANSDSKDNPTQENKTAVIALPSFHTINTRGNVHLIVVPSDSTSAIALEFNGLAPKHFKYKIRKGVLYLDVMGGLLLKNRYIRIIATTPQLSAIVSQNAAVEFLGTMVGDHFSYMTSGGRNSAHLNLDVEDMSIRTFGSSDLSVEGAAISATMSAVAGSRINAIDLKLDSLSALASDGSEIYARPSTKLIARAQSWGTIYYAPVHSIQPEITTGGNVVLIQRANKALRFAEYLGITAQEVLDGIAESAPQKMPDRGVETPVISVPTDSGTEDDFF